jgi:3-deoxy-D-manno-octulosonic-acid transferase
MTPLDIAYLAALGVAGPWLARGKARLREKLTGQISLPPKTRPRVWFHGVSVGEIHLLRTIVPAFRARWLEADAVVSATTATGLDEARRWFAEIPVVPWPFDFRGRSDGRDTKSGRTSLCSRSRSCGPGCFLKPSAPGCPWWS